MFEGAEKFRKELRETKDQELTELAELLEMQQLLDENIYKEKGIIEYPANEVSIALTVELGELMNEFPTKFKYWKSKAVDNREKGLEEYVDCLHFALNIINYITSLQSELDIESDPLYILMFKYSDNTECITFGYGISYILENLTNGDNADRVVPYLFELGNVLGFTWEEIYKAYKDKNKVNYERLQNGY